MNNRSDKGTFLPSNRIGERHGYYTVIRDTGKKNKHGSRIWLAKCDCGKEFEISSDRMSRKKSCGCKRLKNSGMYKADEINGTVVKDIIAIEPLPKRNNGYIVYKSECLLCHSTYEFPSYYFKRGHVNCKCEKWKEKYSSKVGRKPLNNNESTVKSLYNTYKKSAVERNLAFELSLEEFRNLVSSKCYYCGAEPNNNRKISTCYGEYPRNGIDRINNEIGYTKENCVSCCKECNFAKGKMTKDDFLEMVKRIYHNIFEGG